ncbi:MAG: ATP-dependent DNA helicase RecG [Actinomycetota bacterium]|nr:ATP-dependent DNA helicase RecG [Actinomycetota bacterium]
MHDRIERERSELVHPGFADVHPRSAWPPPRGRPRPEVLEHALATLSGVGPALTKKLAKLGLRTVRDALRYRPRRYEAAVPKRRIADMLGGEEVVIAGQVQKAAKQQPRRSLSLVKARVADESGEVTVVWFNQPWLADRLRPGTHVRLRGELKRGEFAVKAYDLNGISETADFAPVYPASEEVSPKKLREVVAAVLPHARDCWDAIPADVKARQRLPLLPDAYVCLHTPRNLAEAEIARSRLAFDELLVLQVGLARRRRGREQLKAPALGPPGKLSERYRRALPFALTPDQERVIAEIDADLGRTVPMQRLLQGEVGSGKTVVALYALLRGVESGRQGALMAPTETLAEQHLLTLEDLLRELGVSFCLLTSAVPAKDHAAARATIASGEAQIAVGTHALIQEEVQFRDLAVAVVDEQHRFGVEQRRALAEGRSPHVLHMTATPIPRTLALTVYGDLAVSEIAQGPAGRKPVVTSWVPQERSAAAYRRLRKHLEAGRQAYVVCPLVSESETSEARAAEQEAERLRRAELRGLRVGCLHGRLRPSERRELMSRFKARELDVLVATTVIEVGVDVPNATIMIVQEADRFGLAQLHQLRGRVGRGGAQSYCLLVSRPKEELTDAARARLEALVATTDGFELAEIDLEIRGGGELLGTRQSGASDFVFTRLRTDRALLERAREEAERLAEQRGPLNDEIERVFSDEPVGA